MISKKYILKVALDDMEEPFIISNKAYRGAITEISDAPTNSELDYVGLRFEPARGQDNIFAAFHARGEESPLSAELIAGLRGKSETWKLIRCGFYDREIVCVLVNPEVYKGKVDDFDPSSGCVEVCLSPDNWHFWVSTRKCVGPDMYSIDQTMEVKLKRSSLVFIEHNKSFWRQSSLHFAERHRGEDDLYTVRVQEDWD